LPTPGEAHAKLARRLEKNLAGRVADPSIKPKKPTAEGMAWQAAGLHCSANERRADEASRDVEAWLKCKYMREHLGEEYSGVVTSATTFGLFVTLDAMYVEGLVHITELGGEYFRFDEARQELRGERTGIRYAIGPRVRIQVSRVDLDGRKIDFRLVNDDHAAAPRGVADKGASREGRGRSADYAERSERIEPEAAGHAGFKGKVRQQRASAKPGRGASKSADKAGASAKKAPRKRR
jgi:ribonuclease R